MPAFGSSTAGSPRDLLEPEAEAVPRRNVAVELVRIGVVRDVQIEAAVAVDVGEHGPEAVTDATALDACALSDFAERRLPALAAPLVEVEEVADGSVVRREAGGGCSTGVGVRVPGDEQVRATVAVDIADGGARVPAECVDPGRLARPR